MGIGVSSGENRATDAAKKAICSPLLETSIDGARGVLMHISGGNNLSLWEVNEAADIVSSAADQEVNMIFGANINPELEEEIVVTVIATGFDHKAQHQAAAASNRQRSSVSDLSSVQSGNNEWDVPAFLRRQDGGFKRDK
jgi:cell division protein FtsZ